MTGRPRTRPFEPRPCDTCAADTDHGQHRAGLTRAGQPRTRWRCLPCLNRTAKTASTRRREARP